MSIEDTLRDVENFLAWQRNKILEDFRRDNPEYDGIDLSYSFYKDLTVNGKALFELESWDQTEKLEKLQKDLKFHA